jgi:carboxyl-terminal processing protease
MRHLLVLALLLSPTLLPPARAAVAPAAPAPLSFAEFQAQESATGAARSHARGACDDKCQELRQEFRYVVHVGKSIYCYWEEKKAATGTDYDARAAEYEASIVTGTSKTAYWVLLRRWAALFHDGHVSFVPKADLSEIEIYSAPFKVETLAPATPREKLIVSDAFGTDLLRVGDEIVAVDGVPTPEALTRGEALVSGSTDRMRRAGAGRRLLDVYGAEAGTRPLELRFLRDGSERTATVFRRPDLNAPVPGGTDPALTGKTGAEGIHTALLPGPGGTVLGYLRIDTFLGSQITELLLQAMDRFRLTDGLLIDLRRNGGGSTDPGDAVLGRFLPSAAPRYLLSPRMSDFMLSARPEYYFLFPWDPAKPFAEWYELTVTPSAPEKSYRKPVVALTSPYCFSACDTFTAALRSHRLATIVGERTGGGTGAALVFDLAVSGHQFRYSTIRGLTSDGQAIEGAGTEPEVVIEPTVEERVSGKDLQLVRALEVLASKVAAAPGPYIDGAQVDAATGGLTPVWAQDRAASPTTEHYRELRGLAPADEL